MRPRLYTLILACFSLFTFGLQAQGLFLKGNEYIIDERTSYRVFEYEKPTFKDSLTISFDFSADRNKNTGYIFRIKTQDPSLIFNLSYDSYGDDIIYKLNEEGKSTLITIKESQIRNNSGNWSHVILTFDLRKQKIQFSIEEAKGSCTIKLPNMLQPDIYFGRSDYFIDLPSFSIRNLQIGNKTIGYSFQFKEHEGNTIYNSNKAAIGHVEQPTWLINRAYYWNKLASFSSTSVAGFNFDAVKNKIYYYNKDSITTYNLPYRQFLTTQYKNQLPIRLSLGYNFINTQQHALYAYELIPHNDGDITMAQLDLETKLWSSVSNKRLPLWLHHHAKFFDASNNRFIIFGGFGNMRYNNEFNCYNLATDTWSKLEFTGDTIFPRYFLSMGYSEADNCLYIFGGMGNESGEYNVGRKYYYDFYKVDLTQMHITKLWEIPWVQDHVVPVKSMLIEKDYFMTLCYPEHFSNTHLKLYKFSLKDGSYEILGDSIPIRSEKITTNADLFYSSEMGELYGVVQEFENDDIASRLTIYTLATPAISYNDLFLSSTETANGSILLYSIIIFAIVLLFLYFAGKAWSKKRLHKKINTDKPPTTKPINTRINNYSSPRRNSIFLFGDFNVFDRNGKDISYMFSTRLKQTFLLILQHSTSEGISTQQLTNTLWADREDEKAKNIRGVTINSLRKVLDELDGISLIYEKSYYKLLLDQSVSCDYTTCLELTNLALDKLDFNIFLEIISRGIFLKDSEDPIFDTFKSSLEQQVDPTLRGLIEKEFRHQNYTTVILLCEAMFNIDPISDFAIAYIICAMERLNQLSEAQKRFYKFIVEYKTMIGEDYPLDYSATILKLAELDK